MQEELYLSFENYLNNEMPDNDKIIFENRLQQEPDFLASFNLYKETTGFAQLKFSKEADDFKANLKSISASHFAKETPSKTKVIQLKPWFYAVAAVLVLFFGLQLFQNGNPVFDNYNQFEPASITVRGENSDNLAKAQKAFNDKNYKEAIPLFESILKQNNSPEINYLYGISLLQDNRILEAEKVFSQLRNGNTIYKDNAVWCLALAKLKQKDYIACKNFILEIPEGADYYEVSRKLLREL
jgi:hypothetical protein